MIFKKLFDFQHNINIAPRRGKKVKLKFIKLFTILLATFMALGSSKLHAEENINDELKNELTEIYKGYKIDRFQTCYDYERYRISVEFYNKLGHLRNKHTHVLGSFVKLFCLDRIPECIKKYAQDNDIFVSISVSAVTSSARCNIAIGEKIKHIVYSFEL